MVVASFDNQIRGLWPYNGTVVSHLFETNSFLNFCNFSSLLCRILVIFCISRCQWCLTAMILLVAEGYNALAVVFIELFRRDVI